MSSKTRIVHSLKVQSFFSHRFSSFILLGFSSTTIINNNKQMKEEKRNKLRNYHSPVCVSQHFVVHHEASTTNQLSCQA